MSFFSHHRKWVYPLEIKGRFQRLHRLAGVFQLGLLFGLPWLTIAGNPAARLDLPARRVYAFGAVFTATDTVLMLLMALMAAFSLFFFTSLFGRLWCGYLCPQTVFLEELIRPLEERIEGTRSERMKLDKEPWSPRKLRIKLTKWTVFAGIAFFLSMSIGGWFAGAPALWTGQAGPVDYALVGIFTGVWFLDFAWFREQLCNYVCPYARFQGALTDDESLVVAYDPVRGEPRGGKAAKAVGGCIDCNKCVAVCPQGIDIRDGYQLECVNCARCIDACESVMGRLGHESLVSYTTVADSEGRTTRWIRPRTVVYAGLLTALLTAFLGGLVLHTPFEAEVARAPGTMFTVDEDGWTRNTYLLTVKSNDMRETPLTYTVQLEGLPEAEVNLAELVVPSMESRTLALVVRVPPTSSLDRTTRFTVRIDNGTDHRVLDATFKTRGGLARLMEP